MLKTSPQVDTPASVAPAVGIRLLQKLVERALELRESQNLQSSDDVAWNSLARDYMTRAFGSDSVKINSVLYASGDGGLYQGISDHEFRNYLKSKFDNKVKLLNTLIEVLETDLELEVIPTTLSSGAIVELSTKAPEKVFVVHGHNHGAKESVARFLDKLTLEPVILHEKANSGRTVIEKFSDYADVSFAVVLLTADDEGRARSSGNEFSLRARQNVILELGYFLGKLGRSKVCALYERGVEIPSDYNGVLFVEFDSAGRWQFDLIKELVGAGFVVDANRVIGAA